MKNLVLLFTMVVFFSQTTIAQSGTGDAYSFGVSLSSVLFSKEDASKIGDRYNSQFPRFNFSGVLSDNFSFDVSLTFNVLSNIEGVINNKFEYTSLDAAIRFNPFRNDATIVPYVGVGASYIGGASTVSAGENALSVNVLAGGAIWITSKFGLIGQFTYKFVSDNATSMASHLQATAGIAYRFGAGSEYRKRLWD